MLGRAARAPARGARRHHRGRALGGPRRVAARDRATSPSSASTGSGRFDPDEVAAAIRPDTALVSVQLANHEVGTLQPAAEVVARRARRAASLVHVDACAAAGHVAVDFGGARRRPLLGHRAQVRRPEGRRRAAGAARAALPAVRRRRRAGAGAAGRHRERARDRRLRRRRGRARPTAASSARPTRRARSPTRLAARDARRGRPASSATAIPTTASPTSCASAIDGVEAEPILLALDQHGVAVHSGSSCSSESLEPSPVLAAMGVDADRSLRASVGWSSTDADVDAFLDALPGRRRTAAGLRRLSALRRVELRGHDHHGLVRPRRPSCTDALAPRGAAARDHVLRRARSTASRCSTNRCPTPLARRPHRPRARRLRVLDEGGRPHVRHRRRGPRQLQRRQPHARVQDARRGRGQLRRRRAARDRAG